MTHDVLEGVLYAAKAWIFISLFLMFITVMGLSEAPDGSKASRGGMYVFFLLFVSWVLAVLMSIVYWGHPT